MNVLRYLRWDDDFADGVVRAQKEDRLLIVYFSSKGPPVSADMSKKTLADPKVVARLKEGFVHVRVDSVASAELFRKLVGERGRLATCVVDGTGDVISVLSGFADAPSYLAFLKRAEKGYEKILKERKLSARPRAGWSIRRPA